MAITSISRDTLTEVVDIVRVVSSNTLAQVATTGYLTSQVSVLEALNNGIWTWLASDVVLVVASDGTRFFTVSSDFASLEVLTTAGNGAVTLPVVANDFVVFDGTLGALKDLGFSASDASKTKVVMAGSAVVAGHMALFSDTAGTIDDTAGTAINLGSIQAGASGTQGTLVSFSATPATGSLVLQAVANSGNTSTVISNAAMGQLSTISIPDPSSSTANFILSKNSGTQHITVGSFQVDAGSITSGLSTGGFIGTHIAYPTTAASGFLALTALVNGSGNFSTTISNSTTVGQSQVISIPDCGTTASNFLLSNSAGTQTVATGNLAFTAGYMQQSAANALTAHAGGGQGSALALARQINRVTTVGTAGDSVLLPVSVAGRVVTVINAAASNAMDIFPQSGDVINALSANTALSAAANKTITFYCAVAGTWNSLLTA